MLEAWPLELTTCTVQVRAVVPMLTGTRICVPVTEVGVKAPMQLSDTFGEDWKPLPVMVSVWGELDAVIGFGLSETIVGGGVTFDQEVARL